MSVFSMFFLFFGRTVVEFVKGGEAYGVSQSSELIGGFESGASLGNRHALGLRKPQVSAHVN